LTPYQFASNSPISGVDLDGLEYFYAGDGRLLGKIGSNNQVFKVENAEDIGNVEQFILWANTSTNEIDYKHNVNMCLSYSCDVGMQNGELNYRATMATIRTTEGHGTPLAYDTYYGGGKMKDYTDHPREIVKKWGYASSAAGAYQIMKNTWFDVGKANG
jgi:hypothetical protein